MGLASQLLKISWDGDCTASAAHVPGLHYPPSCFFPTVQPKPSNCSSWLLLCHIVSYYTEEFVSIVFVIPLPVAVGCCWDHPIAPSSPDKPLSSLLDSSSFFTASFELGTGRKVSMGCITLRRASPLPSKGV